jgi:hypothetical protein
LHETSRLVNIESEYVDSSGKESADLKICLGDGDRYRAGVPMFVGMQIEVHRKPIAIKSTTPNDAPGKFPKAAEKIEHSRGYSTPEFVSSGSRAAIEVFQGPTRSVRAVRRLTKLHPRILPVSRSTHAPSRHWTKPSSA